MLALVTRRVLGTRTYRPYQLSVPGHDNPTSEYHIKFVVLILKHRFLALTGSLRSLSTVNTCIRFASVAPIQRHGVLNKIWQKRLFFGSCRRIVPLRVDCWSVAGDEASDKLGPHFQHIMRSLQCSDAFYVAVCSIYVLLVPLLCPIFFQNVLFQAL